MSVILFLPCYLRLVQMRLYPLYNIQYYHIYAKVSYIIHIGSIPQPALAAKQPSQVIHFSRMAQAIRKDACDPHPHCGRGFVWFVENAAQICAWFEHFLVRGRRRLPPLPRDRAGK